MLGGSFRPWGELQWLLSRLGIQQWSFLGCLSCEDRFIATWQTIEQFTRGTHSSFIKIIDPDSRFTPLIQSKLSSNTSLLAATRPSRNQLDMELFSSLEDILHATEDFVAHAGENVILDVSTFPKRFFFPILKHLVRSNQLKNLVLTYSVPENYTQEALSEEPQPWKEIPYFMAGQSGHDQLEVALVGVGFLPMSLPEVLVGEYPQIEVRLIFPFPPGPPGYNRNWQFIHDIEDNFKRLAEPIRVEATDVSDVFDHLYACTNSASRSSLLAPYGPKPMSIGFCLFAIQTDSPVFYTQPRVYHPAYSQGIAQRDGRPAITGYTIIHQGKNLYQI